MAVTEKNITSTGATSYTFEFEYLKTTDVKVSVNGTATTEFQVPNGAPTTVQFNSGHVPASGAAIRIYRDTNVDNLEATFYAGSAIKSQDLNDNFNQNLYVTQEAKRDAATAWQDGDETINSTETWHTSDDTKIATTKAIEGRIDTKIDTALTTDVSGGDGVTIVDNSPASGQIRVDLDADIATLKDMQSGAATQLASLTSTELGILDGATVTTAELNLLDGVTSTTAELNILDGVTATKDEINLLDGVTSTTNELNILDGVTATKDEINLLDGVTATTAELNILDGVTATKDEINILDGVTATAAELNILDGVTSTAAELNILDGVTATAAELNKLDGVTASTTELNKVDGLTASTTELNILDGVTATTAELNKTDGLTATPTELNTLDGVTSNTSELNKLDGFTGSTNDLNIVSGKSFKTSSGTLDTTSDTEIPSSKAIAAHVASSQTAIGGFITIADEVSFPATASMPANGVVVSINNAAGVVVNGSGVSTTGRTTDGTPATVTINNFPSSLNGETLAAGVGLMVTATSTGNTYNYHKILAAETDVKQLSDDINDFNARYRVASSAPGSSNDAGDMYFDTSSNKMKVYNGTTNAWDDVASVGSFYVNSISSSSSTGGGSATFNGSAYRFTLSNAGTSAQQHIVSVNGVIQKPNAGTSQPSEGFALSGNDIIFSAAPASGSDFFIITSGSSVSIGTPSANSVNSSHIIDGSIVNGDISSTANIAGSKLNDDSIAEVKLDIHNTPSTDKYLKYTSNGMEWSDGASEGTDVKSTGESGTAKFLRVDGDGTCSWQVPPDTVYTHPDHSGEVTSSADGAQTIASNVVDEDNLKVSNSPTNGQFLQAQSGNTGGLTWADVSAAPEISGTASGSIAQDKACIVKTDGNIEQVAKSITQQNPALADTADFVPSGEYLQNGSKIKWIAEKSCFIAMYHTIDASNNRRAKAKVGILGTGSDAKKILWGPESHLSSANWSSIPALGYDPASQHLVGLITYNGGSHSRIRSYTLTVDLSNASNCVIGYANQMTWQQYQNYQPIDVVHDYTANKTVTILVSNSNGSTECRVIEVDSSNGALSWPSGSSAAGMDPDGHEARIAVKVKYIADIGKIAFAYIAGGSGSESLKFNTMNVNSNNSITFNTSVTLTDGINNSSNGQPDNCIDQSWDYDKSIDRFVITYMIHDGSDKGKTSIQIGTYNSSNGNVTWTSRNSILSYSSGSYTSSNQQTIYDENAGRMVFAYIDPRDSNKTKAFTWTANTNGTGSNIGSPTLLVNANQTLADMLYRSSIKSAVFLDRQNSNNVAGKSHSLTSAVATTNMTTENFVGFAKATATNGNSVDIKVVGNTSTQSSLTAGQKYYVQMDGTLGTSADTPSVEAGLALSSTKLLIK